MEKLKRTKQLKSLLHILDNPRGVSEKSINRAAHTMSGRNVPTDIERLYNIEFVKPRVRGTARDGSRYSIYQLTDITQVHNLIKLVKYNCLTNRFKSIDQIYFNYAIQSYEAYFKAAAAKKN